MTRPCVRDGRVPTGRYDRPRREPETPMGHEVDLDETATGPRPPHRGPLEHFLILELEREEPQRVLQL